MASISGGLHLGRKHPDYRKARLWAEDYHVASALPAFKAYVDYASEVYTWPMYLNDQIGDCTCAAYCHCINAWSKYVTGKEQIPGNGVPLSMYEAVGKYIPGNSSTDNGCVMSDILEYAKVHGVAGHNLLAYAQLKNTGVTSLNQALQLYGSVYLGVNLPQSAENQFSEGKTWTYVKGSPIIGGHCVVLQKMDAHALGNYSIVTWGALQGVTTEWMATYLEEAWVMLSPQWLTAKGGSITGVNTSELQADMALLS
jgi:hypothetical protein